MNPMMLIGMGNALGTLLGAGNERGWFDSLFRDPRKTFNQTIGDIKAAFPLDQSMLLSGSPAGLALINQAAQQGALQQGAVARQLGTSASGVDRVKRGLIQNNAGLRATGMRGRLAQQDARTRLQHQQALMQLLSYINQGNLQQGIDPSQLLGSVMQGAGMFFGSRQS